MEQAFTCHTVGPQEGFLTTCSTLLQQQRCERRGIPASNCWRYSAHSEPRATSQSAGQESPAKHRSHQRYSWLFQLTSWELDSGWRSRNIKWMMDDIHVTNIFLADDSCLLLLKHTFLELMVKDCIAGFERPQALRRAWIRPFGPAQFDHRQHL